MSVSSSIRVIVLLALASQWGCVTPPRSTRLTTEDFNHTVTEITQQLLASDLISKRTAESPKMVVVIDKVRNLTSDVISPGEQWMLMARVRSGLTVDAMRQKNITFQLAPERHDLIRRKGYEGDLGPARPATHRMAAVFRSSTRVGSDDQKLVDARTDYYFLEYTIESIQQRETLWTGVVEFKRQAAGLAID